MKKETIILLALMATACTPRDNNSEEVETDEEVVIEDVGTVVVEAVEVVEATEGDEYFEFFDTSTVASVIEPSIEERPRAKKASVAEKTKDNPAYSVPAGYDGVLMDFKNETIKACIYFPKNMMATSENPVVAAAAIFDVEGELKDANIMLLGNDRFVVNVNQGALSEYFDGEIVKENGTYYWVGKESLMGEEVNQFKIKCSSFRYVTL